MMQIANTAQYALI